MVDATKKIEIAYITGVALGDGNLSNPNGRAVRLRITCDLIYPKIIKKIIKNLKIVAPKNKVSTIKRKGNCLDISCYSNDWENILGWKVGSKLKQSVSVPSWIKKEKEYAKVCLCGLIETDGSIYFDRGYKMINFVNHGGKLSNDVVYMIRLLGFSPTINIINVGLKKKYTVRVAKNVDEFIKLLNIKKKPE